MIALLCVGLHAHVMHIYTNTRMHGHTHVHMELVINTQVMRSGPPSKSSNQMLESLAQQLGLDKNAAEKVNKVSSGSTCTHTTHTHTRIRTHTCVCKPGTYKVCLCMGLNICFTPNGRYKVQYCSPAVRINLSCPPHITPRSTYNFTVFCSQHTNTATHTYTHRLSCCK